MGDAHVWVGVLVLVVLASVGAAVAMWGRSAADRAGTEYWRSIVHVREATISARDAEIEALGVQFDELEAKFTRLEEALLTARRIARAVHACEAAIQGLQQLPALRSQLDAVVDEYFGAEPRPEAAGD